MFNITHDYIWDNIYNRGLILKKALVLFLLVFASVLSAGEQIFLDNKDIQQYNGKLGRWVEIQPNTDFKVYAAKFGVTVESISELNNLKNSNNKYIFIPFSPEYMAELESKGITRTVVNLPCNEEYVWPVEELLRISSVLGSRWGEYHPGIDIPAPLGAPILAVEDGRVLSVSFDGGYGLCIVVEHPGGIITRYGHNSVNLVRKGDFVRKGQILALAGSTGRSTGNHCHFEVRCNNIPLNPMDFLVERKNVQLIHGIGSTKDKY